MKRDVGILLLLLLLIFAGCRSSLPPPKPQAASAGQRRFEYPAAGIAFSYPSDWKPVPGSKSQLQVAAPAGGQLTLDVPVLPFHIPGWIPVDQVTSGYVDDFKKRMPDAVVTNLPDPTLPDATQRRIKLAGHLNGKPAIDEAVLIVHNDKVYILAIDSDDKAYPRLHSALDAVLKSLQWTK